MKNEKYFATRQINSVKVKESIVDVSVLLFLFFVLLIFV